MSFFTELEQQKVVWKWKRPQILRKKNGPSGIGLPYFVLCYYKAKVTKTLWFYNWWSQLAKQMKKLGEEKSQTSHSPSSLRIQLPRESALHAQTSPALWFNSAHIYPARLHAGHRVRSLILISLHFIKRNNIFQETSLVLWWLRICLPDS